MKKRMKGRKGVRKMDQSQEATSQAAHGESPYGMPKAPRQKMAGAEKKAMQKVRRAAGANYAGSSGG